jgi:thymidylate synthase (FAD)
MKVTLVTYSGTDDLVVDAARVSLARRASEFDSSRNAGLIAYLAREGHFTPFTHPQITFHVVTTIYTARQLFKSKIGLHGGEEDEFTENEVSRRYVDSTPTFERPVWRAQKVLNKAVVR